MVGISITKVEKIYEMLKRRDKIFTKDELKYSKNEPIHLAGIFAAKKSIQNMYKNKKLKNIKIIHRKYPCTNVRNCKVSISHTDEYAVAIAYIK
jgi:phosphopantetheinyl transferase (holo-ACP synthase)